MEDTILKQAIPKIILEVIRRTKEQSLLMRRRELRMKRSGEEHASGDIRLLKDLLNLRLSGINFIDLQFSMLLSNNKFLLFYLFYQARCHLSESTTVNELPNFLSECRQEMAGTQAGAWSYAK